MKVNLNGRKVERESGNTAADIFRDSRTLRMIDGALETANKHCQRYPRLAKERTITIKISVKPIVDEEDMEAPVERIYSKAELSVHVCSPTLPRTKVSYKCSVSKGVPYFNVEEPGNPEQLTFRDVNEEEKETETSN